ncbi:VanZ family protein [Listeria grandensis]|uniref:VanZ family protein n=1 Tax=Listeria grandensis TaxID=1494963 RepID=UPI0016269DF9|nr:VanZ family protein [Listeria grandensis]MBC1475421.1 VanZ family protein [Listeria grandensis]
MLTAKDILLIAPIIYLFFLFQWIRKKESIEKIVFKSFMFIYLTGVVGYTMFPIMANSMLIEDTRALREGVSGINVVPFATIWEIYIYSGDMDVSQGIFQVVANVIMFIPLGCLYPLCSKYKVGWKRMFLIVITLSMSIELLQLLQNILYQSAFKYVDIDDLIWNVSGGMIGYGLFRLCKPIFQKLNIYHF